MELEDKQLYKKIEEFHFNNQLYLYMSRKIVYNKFDIYLSDIIDDSYWNLATNIKSKNIEEFISDSESISKIMNENNRTPVIYITNNSPIYKYKNIIDMKILHNDVWLLLDKLDEFKNYKSKLDIEICIASKETRNEFINARYEGFSSDDPEDPYDNSDEGYREALEKSFDLKEGKDNIVHYFSKYNDNIVSTATVVYSDDIAFIYNVTTNKKYKRNGICKEMMSYIVKKLKEIDIKYICLQTERGYYTELVYKNMGFKEIFEGIAYSENK